MKAMILAAGLGTRLRPITDTMPKALVKVGGYTMLELTIRYLKKYGIEEIVINVHHFPGQIVRYLEDNNGFGLAFSISDESDQLMDTGGALSKASNLLQGTEPFVLMGVDVLTNLDLSAMLRYHLANRPLATLAVKDRPTSRSLLFNDRLEMVGWRDNSSGTTKGENALNARYALGYSVIQLVDPGIFSLISEKGPFSIIDLYLRLMYTEKIIGFRHDESIWLEFGRLDRLDDLSKSDAFLEVVSTF
jgi:N-acetyl-alpha-D-muramate 1-phosphate uridylyltransferase